MRIADLHHVSINVTDMDAAMAFYVDLLGLRPLPRPDFGIEGAWLDCGAGRQVHLIAAEVVPTDVGQHFAFRADDIDDTVAALEGGGVDVTGPFDIGAGRQAFFHDPAGNRLELNEPAG